MTTIRRFLKGGRITDEDRASKVIVACLASGRFSYCAFLKSDAKMLQITRDIYRWLGTRSCAFSSSEQMEFDELLEIVEYNEDEVVRFLKYRCWRYRRLLDAEVMGLLTDLNNEFEQLPPDLLEQLK